MSIDEYTVAKVRVPRKLALPWMLNENNEIAEDVAQDYEFRSGKAAQV